MGVTSPAAKTELGTLAESLLSSYFGAAKSSASIGDPAAGRILSKLWTGMYDRSKELGPMWRRDWDEFASLFADERRKALVRLNRLAGK